MTITDITPNKQQVLPRDLAPALADRLRQLLAEVTLTSAPPLAIDLTYSGRRCVVCHEGGKLGGHHGDDGQVEWIHKTCHRQLHHRGRLSRTELGRIRQLERRSALAC
jgi:hypothetical protein